MNVMNALGQRLARSAGAIHIPRRVALTMVVGCLMIVGGCGGCNIGANTGGGPSATSPTATAATAATATPAAGATPTNTVPPAAPTKTPPLPTATPKPTLHATVVTRAFNPVGHSTNSNIIDLSCPAGYLVAGGGVSSGYTTFNLMWNAPISTTTWRGEIFNTDVSTTIYAQLQVVCLKVSGLVGQIITKGAGTIPSGSNSAITDVTCPAGYLAAGGGVNAGYGTLVTMQSAPISTTTWRGEVWNTGGGGVSAQFQVVCLKASGLTGKVIVAGLGNVNPGANSTIVSQACPAGYLVAGGGLSSGYFTQTLMQSEPISATTWRSEIFNTGGGAITGQAQVTCLKIA
jgi:hypothetical protein